MSSPASAVLPRHGVRAGKPGRASGGSALRPLAAAGLALLLGLAVPMPGQAQSAGTVEVAAGTAGTVKVDLRTDAHKDLLFTMDEADFEVAKTLDSMRVTVVRCLTSTCPADAVRITLAAQRGADGVWSASLPVDTRDLIKGDWTVGWTGVRPNPQTGAAESGTIATRPLKVELTDSQAPDLRVLPLGDPVRLGPGGALEATVQDEFLRSVTVQHGDMPNAVAIAEPYRVPVDALPEGLSNVTVTATDRAGGVSTVTVQVDRDTVQPVLSLSVPSVGYYGVPFAITANVTERSPYEVRLLHNGTGESRLVGATSGAVPFAHVFVATITDEDSSFAIEAIDAANNRASATFTVPMTAPPTDLRVVSLSAAPGPVVFVGHPTVVAAQVEQVGGVTPLPVAITFTTLGQSTTLSVTVPAAGPIVVPWNVSLPPGRRDVTVHVEPPAFANETNRGNENATATFETYLGSVRVGNDLFFIRADDRGLPDKAVDQASGKSYALTLNNSRGGGVTYRFQLAGNRTGVWDPLDPIAEPAPAGSSSSSSSSKAADRPAPAPAAPAIAMLLVALAAMVQRRRR